jgi:hypothetical protein
MNGMPAAMTASNPTSATRDSRAVENPARPKSCRLPHCLYDARASPATAPLRAKDDVRPPDVRRTHARFRL